MSKIVVKRSMGIWPFFRGGIRDYPGLFSVGCGTPINDFYLYYNFCLGRIARDNHT